MRWIVAAGIAATVFAASPASALTTGQCVPAEQARQAVAAEAMSPLIVGNRAGLGVPTALIFFANADGSKGYALLSDKPNGEQATRICVQSVYRDIHLNDITKAGIPSWAQMPVDRAWATAICARGGLGYQDSCLPHDETLANLEKGGVHVMLTATGTAINPRDNSVRTNQRITIAVRPADWKGVYEAATIEGASYMLAAYTSVSYTQYSKAFIRK